MSVKKQLLELAAQVLVVEEKVKDYESANHQNAQERYNALVLQQAFLFQLAHQVRGKKEAARQDLAFQQAAANVGLVEA